MLVQLLQIKGILYAGANTVTIRIRRVTSKCHVCAVQTFRRLASHHALRYVLVQPGAIGTARVASAYAGNIAACGLAVDVRRSELAI